MRYRAKAIGLAAALVLALPGQGAAQEAGPDDELRTAHAVLLGLSPDGTPPERDGMTDIYYSIVDNPGAPRLVTRLEIAVNPCRSRVISALQFPGEWASMTLAIVDLSRIASAEAYASADDMIAERNRIGLDDTRVQQVVLTGEGLYCSSRLSLAGEEMAAGETCGDRLDLAMADEEQQALGRRALSAVARLCDVGALQE